MMNEHTESHTQAGATTGFANATLDEILTLVNERSGIDFRSYRRSTIERRLLARTYVVGDASYDAYLQRLKRDSAELDYLVHHLTIKVSRFFRNAPVFDQLRQIVRDQLLNRATAEPLRLWSAGCANGEEAYSLAILLAEANVESQRPGSLVYASDIDEKALGTARVGSYSREALEELPPEMIAAYFGERQRGTSVRYAIRQELQSLVRFLPHDLTTADTAPNGLPFDLICCRNVLIYFDQQLQERVVRLLYNSLAPEGYLCLGEAEWLTPSVRDLFDVVDRSARIFRLKAGAGNQNCRE